MGVCILSCLVILCIESCFKVGFFFNKENVAVIIVFFDNFGFMILVFIKCYFCKFIKKKVYFMIGKICEKLICLFVFYY